MHRNLTPGMRNKLPGRVLSGVLLLAAASGLMAQNTDLNSYQGPGISSPGVGNIGTRSGEQVDLRYYFGVSGIVDNSIVPFATDAQGNLVRVPYLYGVEVEGGAYGVHSWKRSQLALDYRGSYTKYTNYDLYSGTNHSLSLGYTYQFSRHLVLDLRESAGSLTYATGQVADAASNDLNSSFTPVTRLFDTRTYYLQSNASATWIQSPRMSYTFGGGVFLQNLKSAGLSNGWGYDFNGSMRRRMSRTSTVGVTYGYSHFEFPGFSYRSDSHTFHGLYATSLGRFWTFSIQAGATLTKGESAFTFALNPVLAAILGQSTITGISNYQTIYPSGTVELKRHFRRSELGFNYFRGVNSGNGATTTGRLDNATASISYTGIRRLNLGADGGYYGLKSIGQNLGNFYQYSVGGGINYALGRDIHLSVRYDLRDVHVDVSAFQRTGSRATVGLLFSPGNLPLSLW
ncbi:MAG: hypothetical protein ABI833_15880 [Acidobacteriota bacterium]